MNNFNCEHFQAYGKQKLEKMLENKIIFDENKGMTNRGWSTISINWKVYISSLALALNRARKAIKRELLNGSVLNPVSDVSKPHTGFIYSVNKSEFIKKQKQEKNVNGPKLKKTCN